MHTRFTLTPPHSARHISWRGTAVYRLFQVTLFLLVVLVVPLSEVVAADTPAMIVKLDGKSVFIPEIKLTKRVNPVTMLLYIGSWRGNAKGNQESLCTFDLKNNSIIIESPEKLLGNSKTRVVNRNNLNPFLDGIIWGRNQVTHFAFKVVASSRQPAVIELFTDSDAVLFNNGNVSSRVSAASAVGSGGRGYLPLMLEAGENVINIKQYSSGEPRIQPTIFLDHSLDLQAAWQTQGGLLKKLVHMPSGRASIPELDWNPYLGNFSVSIEVRDVSTNNILLRKESARRGKIFSNEAQIPAPGVYEIVYRTQNDSASEFFIVGNPQDIFAELQDKLLKNNPDSESKPDIEAQLRRARILLVKENYNIFDRQFQEKLAYTFNCLATFERRLREGVTNLAKDQPGLHIRGFTSMIDGASSYHRLFVPSTYNPDVPLPLLIMAPTRIENPERPFIEGPVMADLRGALLWAKHAEKHGVALLWPPYRSAPEGYSYESVHINEAIQAVERDYNIDKKRISLYASCSAGYNAGRLVSEYENRFAAIVYDRAVFNLTLPEGRFATSIREWLEATNPIPHVLKNRNLKIFVMHDDTMPPGHGQMELTTYFLFQAEKIRDDIVSYLSKRPMSEASRMDQVFAWLAPCRNEKPNDMRSHFLEKAGYSGPILETFATSTIVVVGSHASDNRDQENIQFVVEALAWGHEKYFHGAKCVVKIDDDVTQDDIKNRSLILIGNPQSNSVWAKLQPRIPLTVTSEKISYKGATLTEKHAFQAVVRNPYAAGKFVLMIGAGDLQNLRQVTINDIFRAWYDCIVFTTPRITIGKLDARADALSDK